MREAPTLNPLVYIPVHVKDKLFSIYDIFEQHYYKKCGHIDICYNLLEKISEKLECSQGEAKEYVGYLVKFESIEELLDVDENIFTDKGGFEEKMFYEYKNKEAQNAVFKILHTLNVKRRCF